MVIDRTASKAADPSETEPAAAQVDPPDSAAIVRPRATQIFVLLGKIAISAAVILYLSVKFDLTGALRLILLQQPEIVAAGVAILCIQIGIAALRWRSVLATLAGSISSSRTVGAFYVAAFFNTCFPAGVAGDVVRIWLVRADAIGLVRAFNSVLIDRIVTVLTLLILCASMLPVVWQRIVAGKQLFLAVPLLGAAGLIVIAALVNLDRLPRLKRVLVELRLVTLTSVLDRLAVDSRAVFCSARALAGPLGLGLASHVTVGAAVYVLAVGLNVGVTMAESQLVMPIILLVTSLPVSIGGWGPRELAMVYLLGAFGVPGDKALSLSIEFGMCSILAALPGAVVWIIWRRRAGRTA
jgi:glycosyltransferase 2 family protein